MGNPTHLQNLLLGPNQLYGEIPTTITRLNQLSVDTICLSLELCGNDLTISDPEVEAFVIEHDYYWSRGCP